LLKTLLGGVACFSGCRGIYEGAGPLSNFSAAYPPPVARQVQPVHPADVAWSTDACPAEAAWAEGGAGSPLQQADGLAAVQEPAEAGGMRWSDTAAAVDETGLAAGQAIGQQAAAEVAGAGTASGDGRRLRDVRGSSPGAPMESQPGPNQFAGKLVPVERRPAEANASSPASATPNAASAPVVNLPKPWPKRPTGPATVRRPPTTRAEATLPAGPRQEAAVPSGAVSLPRKLPQEPIPIYPRLEAPRAQPNVPGGGP
jgi:hypothetical protein